MYKIITARREKKTPKKYTSIITLDVKLQMKVFEEEWLKNLSERYDYRNRYTAPFIAKLAFDPMLKPERDIIEAWFDKLPEEAKPDILSRLRSINSRDHFGAYFELVLHQFLIDLGFTVCFHPKIEEGNPDLLIEGKNLTKPTFIEVATVFDESRWENEEQKFNIILERLNAIEHYYSLIISNKSEQIPEDVNYDELKYFVQSQLDSFHSQDTSNPREFEYKQNALELELTVLPNLSKSPIVLSHGGPARFVGTDQLRSAIEKKVNKYKSVKDLGLGFVVALNLANVPAGELGLLNMLFGDVVVRIKRNIKGEPIEVKEGRNFKGLFTPKPGLEGKARHTRLSAVFNIVSKWPEHNIYEPVRRVHNIRIIHNPWALNSLNVDVFKGLPQFTVVSEDDAGINLGWINNV